MPGCGGYEKTLVIGATGNVGREVVAQLPAASVRILSRKPAAGGCTEVGDLARPESLVAALGRELRFEPVAVEDARAQMLADGRPAALVEALLAGAGRPPSTLITSTIGDVTGSPARTFGSWAEEHVGEFR